MPRAAGRIVVPCSAPTAVLEQLDAARFFRQQRYVLESFAATANLFVRRAVFDAVGHFDERLLSGGDQEFGARAHAAGVPIDYAPAAVVHHAARRSLSELLAKAHRVGVGFGQGLRYHSFAHLGAGPRIADRLRLISHAARRDDLLGPVRLALVAGQTLLAASTAVGLMDGFVGLRR
jgi:hypothetical protein